ncbi:dehydrogenase [Xaviernesmea oryzae]|uniref:Dehydrogenase n=1 Tax=Xaviernesmea oryzae TaxID=464029 RepID=A0A1Q9AZ76_9HYPH|nr:2-hydroxyacid dehydrogenase [Xaviernesmea oryzae]OLP61007.1 dehydrogenase [Xaviernesmea oryzae]SEL17594.1 Lactate dehydrogenase [Xaviernesmea oryzae]
MSSEQRPVIVVPGRMHPRVLARLPDTFEMIRLDEADPALVSPELGAKAVGIATTNRLPADFLAAFQSVEIVANFSVGYDGIAVEAAAERGVVVTNTPDVLNEEVADTAIALLLNSLRRFPAAEAYLRAGHWAQKGPFPLTPLSLRGRSVGIYGLGRIGQAIARRLEGFGLPISYHTRSRRDDVAYTYYPSLKAMAEAVDTLISIVPGSDETRHTLNAEIFQALGSRGVVINVGRGSTLDETALVAALKEGTIAAAGLDVFENEPHVPEDLIALENATLLPHVASASEDTRNAMADLVVDNLKSWFATGKALTPVPETPFERKG